MAGFQLGSAIGLALSPILMSKGGLFGPFVIFGLSGFLWVIVWIAATSSSPELCSQISRYELKLIQKGKSVSSVPKSEQKEKQMMPPFRRLLSKLPTWSLIVANAMHSWVMCLLSFISNSLLLVSCGIPYQISHSSYFSPGVFCHTFMDADILQHCEL